MRINAEGTGYTREQIVDIIQGGDGGLASAEASRVSASGTDSRTDDDFSLAASGSPEDALMLASLNAEKSGDRARELRTRDRHARSTSRRRAIAHDRDAASMKMWSSIIGSVASVAGSAVASGGGADAKLDGQLVETLGQVTSAVVGDMAAGETEAAQTERLLADEANERAQQSGQFADAEDRHAGKMMDGASKISEEAHRARMAAIRG